MNTYNKQEVERILNDNLLIHWWNFGTKTLCFKGTVKEYLTKHQIEYKVKIRTDTTYELLQFTFKFSIGSMQEISYKVNSLEDGVRMALNIKLSYLGDKSKYTFNNRTRTINF